MGCTANEYNNISKDFDKTLEQLIIKIDSNGTNIPIEELQNNLKKMKGQIRIMKNVVPSYKKPDYEESYNKYNMINTIVYGFGHWKQLNEDEKVIIKMKIIALKSQYNIK